MIITDFKDYIKNNAEYGFLHTNPKLQNNIILLGLGGSYAYGTNTENSDLDVRGIAVNSKLNILSGSDFEQVVDTTTDTTIYSLDKMINLLYKSNPNTIEILGLKPEHYLTLSKSGKMLLDNTELFLSKLAVGSFGGYANTQLRRLENKSARKSTQEHQEYNILKSIENATYVFNERYNINSDTLNLYLDKSEVPTMTAEIFMDVNLKHYPLRDYLGLWNELNNIIKDYDKIGHRNEKAIAHDKLSKHMMHLVRLYYMCFDILENHKIVTYREQEHDLLMSIRSGIYLDSNDQVTSEFYELVNAMEQRLDYDKKNTDLPAKPDIKKIQELHAAINESVINENF